MRYQVLTESEVDQFIERGYIRLKEAYPRQAALDAQDFLWDRFRRDLPGDGEVVGVRAVLKVLHPAHPSPL